MVILNEVIISGHKIGNDNQQKKRKERYVNMGGVIHPKKKLNINW